MELVAVAPVELVDGHVEDGAAEEEGEEDGADGAVEGKGRDAAEDGRVGKIGGAILYWLLVC